MDETIQNSIQAFLHNLHLDSAALEQAHQVLLNQLSLAKNEAENLSEASLIPNQKFAILNQQIDKIPKLQERVDSAARKLLEAHKAISFLRKEIEQLSQNT